MTDIVVTLPRQYGLDHLHDKNQACFEGLTTWWDFARLPKKLESTDKVFVVFDGEVLQYFTILEINKEEKKVYFEEVREIKPIQMKGFQGFRYRKFEYEEASSKED
jgi:hypothetical protein